MGVVSGIAPDAGEDYTALAERFPTPPASRGHRLAITGSSAWRLSRAISPAT
jgi:hypothetical protein